MRLPRRRTPPAGACALSAGAVASESRPIPTFRGYLLSVNRAPGKSSKKFRIPELIATKPLHFGPGGTRAPGGESRFPGVIVAQASCQERVADGCNGGPVFSPLQGGLPRSGGGPPLQGGWWGNCLLFS